MAEREPTPVEALEELQEILMLGAFDQAPQRVTATRYTLCRKVLLGGELAGSMPGFLRQCTTIDSFRIFIQLYHSNLEARLTFIGNSFEGTSSRLRRRRAVDLMSDSDLGLR
jgi:hypothetical protein